MSKARAHLDEWCKAIASSTELRTWYHHDPSLFEEFAHRYRVELTEPGRATALTLWDRRAAVDFVSYRINPGTDSTTRGRIWRCCLLGRSPQSACAQMWFGWDEFGEDEASLMSTALVAVSNVSMRLVAC